MTGSSSEYSSLASSFWTVAWSAAAWGVPIVNCGADMMEEERWMGGRVASGTIRR